MTTPPRVLLGPDLRGLLLAGRYHLGDILGAGATATVYTALDHHLGGHRVAVKVIHPEHARAPEQRRRIRQEALLGARLDHPHLLPVLDFAEHLADTGERHPFLVLPRVEGPTLRDLILAGPLPWPRAVDLVLQLLDALAALHQRGVLHRDIKSGNCIVARRRARDHLYLLDLGLARIDAPGTLSLTSPPLSRAGGLRGTLLYLAPELARGEAADPRADLYAVGVLLFELLTRRYPFEGSEYAILRGHIERPAPTPSALVTRNEIPAALDALVQRALAKEPSERFTSASAFAKSLAELTPDTSSRGPQDPSITPDDGSDAAQRALAAWTRFDYAHARHAAAEAAQRSQAWSPLRLLLSLVPED